MAGTGTSLEKFGQYSSGIADASYAFDFVARITVGAGATSGNITFPVQANVFRIRNVVITDVTSAEGGTPGSLIACFVRTDGHAATSGILADGSASRLVKPGASIVIARFVPSETGVSIYNPNGAAVIIQVELGA